MAKISDKIKQLRLNDYYVVSQETDLTRTPIVEGRKVSLGRFNGAGIKGHYVKLYKQATIDNMRPTVAIHVYQDARRSETGLRIQSTEITYWLLAPTEDFDAVYPELVEEVGAATDGEPQYSATYVPSKGFLIKWSADTQRWNTFGYEQDNSLSPIGEATHLNCVDVTCIRDKKTGEISWHVNIATSPDVEDSAEDGEDITTGMWQGEKVVDCQRALFTSIGSVYAMGSLATSH